MQCSKLYEKNINDTNEKTKTFELWREGQVVDPKEHRLPRDMAEYEFLRKPGWKDGDPVHLTPCLLLHLYNNPQGFGNETVFLLRLPKRRRNRLMYEPPTVSIQRENIGYGIHLQQGPAEARFQVVVVVVAAVAAVCICVIVDKKSADNGPSFPWTVCGFLWGAIVAVLNIW